MNIGTTLLALLVLGGAGYGAYRVMNDPHLAANKYAKPDKWTQVRERAGGKRYVVYVEGYGLKGFDPIAPGSGVSTNDMIEAQTALSRTADLYIQEANDYASGKISSDALRGISAQQVGIYDVVQNRILDKYDITTPTRKRLR